MEEYEVTHRPERNRFELEKNGMTAFVEYEVEDGTLDIMHTIVPPPLEGKGIAAALVEATYKYAAGQGLKPMFVCRSLAEAASGGINGTSSNTVGDVSKAFSPEDYTDCHRLEC